MIAIAMLIVCAGCVSALTISTSTVRTEDGEVQSMTSSSSSGSTGSTPSPDESVSEETEEKVVAVSEEDEEKFTDEGAEVLSSEEVVEEVEEVANTCTEKIENELIIKFEPEYFERSDGTLDELAMEEAGLKIHDSIDAVILSDLTEFGMPGLQLVRLPEGMSLEEGIAYYEALPEVRFAEPNYQISIYRADECVEGEETETPDESSTAEV
jgi:hypothetical protein